MPCARLRRTNEDALPHARPDIRVAHRVTGRFQDLTNDFPWSCHAADLDEQVAERCSTGRNRHVRCDGTDYSPGALVEQRCGREP